MLFSQLFSQYCECTTKLTLLSRSQSFLLLTKRSSLRCLAPVIKCQSQKTFTFSLMMSMFCNLFLISNFRKFKRKKSCLLIKLRVLEHQSTGFPRNSRQIRSIKVPPLLKPRITREHCMLENSIFKTIFKLNSFKIPQISEGRASNIEFWYIFLDRE